MPCKSAGQRIAHVPHQNVMNLFPDWKCTEDWTLMFFFCVLVCYSLIPSAIYRLSAACGNSMSRCLCVWTNVYPISTRALCGNAKKSFSLKQTERNRSPFIRNKLKISIRESYFMNAPAGFSSFIPCVANLQMTFLYFRECRTFFPLTRERELNHELRKRSRIT